MTTNASNSRAITLEKLCRWGLLRQVRREELRDQCLESTTAPNKDKALLLQKQWCVDHKLTEPNSLKNWQQQHGLNSYEWAAHVERPWRWSQWCLKQFNSEIPAYYLKRKPSLDTVSYSLLRVKQKPLATELYLRIKERESTFEDIASNYSDGPEREWWQDWAGSNAAPPSNPRQTFAGEQSWPALAAQTARKLVDCSPTRKAGEHFAQRRNSPATRTGVRREIHRANS